MNGFLARSDEDRASLFERAGDEMGLDPAAMEKDFWVCWALREVFGLEVGSHLAFKGGTSLSKCFGVIERFSEDIDLVIERDFLGFAGDRAPESAPSGNERKRRVEAVLAASRDYVINRLLPSLERACRPQLKAGRIVSVMRDPDSPDQQTLLVEYASVMSSAGYLRPVVKLELGARSDTEPNEFRVVQPYLVRLEGHGLTSVGSRVRVVAAERTFWDKVALLHEEGFRSDGPRPRLARHYYDVWSLDRHGVAKRAMESDGLFEQVVSHRRTYFPLRKHMQDGLRRGSIRLVPHEARMKEWRDDFLAMRDTMFFGAVPSFDEMLPDLRELERRINAEP